MLSFAHILVIGWMFSAGWVPFDNAAVADISSYERVTYASENLSLNSGSAVCMELNAVLFDHVNIRGAMKSWQTPVTAVNWSPYKMYYGIGADVYLFPMQEKEFNVVLSVDRSCSHPVYGWGTPLGNADTCYCEVKLTVTGTKDIL